jgi:hypothetical protein
VANNDITYRLHGVDMALGKILYFACYTFFMINKLLNF